MPRPKGIPGYCLHKPSGQARVIINGQHIYLGQHGSPESRMKYQEISRKHLADRTKPELERSVRYATDITIAEIMLRYILPVKLHSDVVDSARIVSAIHNEPMSDMISDILRPILAKMEQEEMGRRMRSGSPDQPKRREK